jgi:hypothetical protein
MFFFQTPLYGYIVQGHAKSVRFLCRPIDRLLEAGWLNPPLRSSCTSHFRLAPEFCILVIWIQVGPVRLLFNSQGGPSLHLKLFYPAEPINGLSTRKPPKEIRSTNIPEAHSTILSTPITQTTKSRTRSISFHILRLAPIKLLKIRKCMPS